MSPLDSRWNRAVHESDCAQTADCEVKEARSCHAEDKRASLARSGGTLIVVICRFKPSSHEVGSEIMRWNQHDAILLTT